MTEHQHAAHQLAQAIASYRVAEKAATRSLVILDCTLHNVASQYGLTELWAAMWSTRIA